MSRLLRALLAGMAGWLLYVDSGMLLAQPTVLNEKIQQFDAGRLDAETMKRVRRGLEQAYEESKRGGCGNPYLLKHDPAAFNEALAFQKRCLEKARQDSIAKANPALYEQYQREKATYETAVFANAKRLQDQGADPYAALVPTDPWEAAFNSRKEKARQDSLERLEEAQRRVDEEKRERLGRWLWAVPLSVFALVVLVAVRGEPVKAWIGRLHGGQVFILASGLLVGGLLSLVAALLIDSIPTAWITGFVPVGAVSAVLVLWFWFGARAKPDLGP